ncbi:MAG: hypothetical protein QM680_07355 [Luteolibacter sp.]
MPDFDSESHESRKPELSAPLVHSAHNARFADFLRLTRHAGRIPEAGGKVNWKTYEYEYCEKLLECLEGSPKHIRQSNNLSKLIDGLEFLKGGDEHFIHENDSVVIKYTYGNNFGMCLNVYPEDMPGYDGPTVIPTGNFNHQYYLLRWMLLNAAFGPITSFLGMIPPEQSRNERLPALAIGQMRLPGDNPPLKRIISSFRKLGFVHISEHAYYRPKDNLLLGDAAPRNVRIIDDEIIPFDAVAERPKGKTKALCLLKASKYS